jgi:dTMP kinase
MARVSRAKDRIEQRGSAYHAQVRENFLAQARDDPSRYRVIDADRPIAQVACEVWEAAREVLGV